MKKFAGTVMCLLLLCSLAFGIYACDKPSRDNAAEVYQVNEEFLADDYHDYASEAHINTTDYPLLADQGLKIVTGYGENDYSKYYEADASNEENIRNYFDPTKPTIIIIHGIQLNVGRDGIVGLQAENRRAEVSSSIYNKYVDGGEIEYLAQDSNFNTGHELSKYWFDGGAGQAQHNVFYFHYERFADTIDSDEMVGTMDAPGLVTNYIWSAERGVKAVYYDEATAQYAETAPGEALGGFSLAEFYAAEYLRAFGAVDKLYPEYKTSGKVIRTAAHSMGGVLNVAGNLLLQLLADEGKIDRGLLVSRMMQMDSFIGFDDNNTTDKLWSGKQYVKTNDESGFRTAGENYVSATEILALKYGVAVDSYLNTGFSVPFLTFIFVGWDNEQKQFVANTPTLDMAVKKAAQGNRLLKVSAMVVLEPYFARVVGVMTEGHNPIREWVLSSYLYEAPTVVDDDGTEYTVPTARMSNSDVIASRGTFYAMLTRKDNGEFNEFGVAGSDNTETVRCDDDGFVKLI